MKLPHLASTLATFALAATLATPTSAQDITRPVLSLATAKKIADGCEARAKAEGWKMNIAVLDDGGNLKYFTRMDGAFLGSVKIAQMKADTSARFPVSSRQWGQFAQNVKGLELVPGTITFAGGLPIFGAGTHLGGVGVSGGTADQDEQCAQAGLDAAKDVLK
jgi:uncharacterized protein GlcG (DUF336 family)